MLESCSPHVASWIMGDTIEHMYRTDLMIVMQLLGKRLAVPDSLVLEDVLDWLRTGEIGNEALRAWWAAQNKLEPNQLDRRTDLTEIGACMYVSHPEFKGNITMQGVVDIPVCRQVGSRLFGDNAGNLQKFCQIHASQSGEEILQCMLVNNVNQNMTWPSVFGTRETLPHFWVTGEPQQPQTKLTLAPLRVVVTGAREACLFVDARWLLLYCSMCGVTPSQASRFLGVSKWIEYFYYKCIPDRMVCNPWLFTGLPSPLDNCGLIQVPHRKSGRRTILRHGQMRAGLNAPIISKVVEDLGPAALRYQLAHMLQMDERMLPTDSVSYSFPVDMWCPVKLLGAYGSLKWEGRRQRFWLRTQAGGEENISATAIHDVANVFLSGRVTRDIRPLCMFDRPGVVVRMIDGGVGLIVAFDAEATHHYKILCEEDVVVQMHPYAVEDAVLPVDSSLVLRLSAFPERERYHFRTEDDEEAPCEWIHCKLAFMQREQENRLCVSVNVDQRDTWRGAVGYGSSHGSEQRARQRMDIMVRVDDVACVAPAGALVCDKAKPRNP